MIGPAELAEHATRFGAPESQVARDHMISHVLLALSAQNDRVTFFGGTALCRTWLPDLRLSEDIDLLVDTTSIGPELTKIVSQQIRREFPNHEWSEHESRHQVATWILSDTEIAVRVQFVEWRKGWHSIPTTNAAVQLRYSDLPESANLLVPTPSGFATLKLMAWYDRHAPRDLFDLAALADADMIDRGALDLIGPIAGFTPSPTNLERTVPPSAIKAWQSELGHQVTEFRTAESCLETVRKGLERASVLG